MNVGARVKTIGKTKHTGATGTVICDYDQYVIVELENHKDIPSSWKREGCENKVIQCNVNYIIEIKRK